MESIRTTRLWVHQGRGLRAALCACIAGLVALSTTNAWANVVYSYFGPTFSTVSGPYTTSDNLQGEIVLASELPYEELNFFPVTPLAFRFLDGVNQIESGVSNIVSSSFEFRTYQGFTGSWRFIIVSDQGGGGFAIVESEGGVLTNMFDRAQTVTQSSLDEGIVTGYTGAWGLTVTPVPEPATLGLVAVALLTMGLTARRRQHKALSRPLKTGTKAN